MCVYNCALIFIKQKIESKIDFKFCWDIAQNAFKPYCMFLCASVFQGCEVQVRVGEGSG